MPKDPAVLFYTSDFLSGTAFFTDEQKGQYITLLCQQHQSDIIPEEHMIKVCGSINSPVVSKFKKANGGYYNVRMREEKERRAAYCEGRRKNKLNGSKKEKEVEKAEPEPMPTRIVETGIIGGDAQNLLEAYFYDFPNSVNCENIARILKVDKAVLVAALPAFRKAANLSYPNGIKFAEHFKNWYLKQKSTEQPKEFKVKKLGQ